MEDFQKKPPARQRKQVSLDPGTYSNQDPTRIRIHNRGRLLGRRWDKSCKSFPPCCKQSPQLTDFTTLPPPLLSKSRLKLICDINIVYGNLKSENSQDYAQKP